MIDCRKITIGVHLRHQGCEVVVDEVLSERTIFVRCEDGGFGAYARIGDVEPILITSELLIRMGFDCCSGRWHKGYSDSYEKCLDGRRIGVSRTVDDWWRVHLVSGHSDRGNTQCRYLHEMEIFLRLHDVELINR